MLIEKQKIDIVKCLTEWKTPLAIICSLLILTVGFIYQILALFIPAMMDINIIVLAVNLALLFFVFSSAYMSWRDYVEPFQQLEVLTESMLAGSLDTAMQPRKNSKFVPLSDNINALAKMLMAQSTQTEKQLNDHLEHITEKTHSLKVLYDVAASVSQSKNINHLLIDYLHILMSIVNAVSASVQIQTSKNSFKIIETTGFLNSDAFMQLLNSSKEANKTKTEYEWSANIDQQLNHIGIDLKNHSYGMICLPLSFKNRYFGSYSLIIDLERNYQTASDNELLISISQHLSIAINQNKLKKESDMLSRVEERTVIANELHDSLAQTIASIRFQARVLDDSLHQEDDKSAWHEMEKLENSIDEANTELRELISHFKAPVFEQGLIPGVEQSVKRFRQETGTAIFLQKEWPNTKLPIDIEIQILRIIQESLANIKKHAEANAVRVLLKGNEKGDFKVLIEDDGIGFSELTPENNAPGEHIGLSIMQERAMRINGQLKIESELEEGTHVMLSFTYISSESGTD